MAEPILPEPSPAARELLRAFREHESPSPATREEGFAVLQARLERSEPAPAANGRLYLLKATLVTVAVAAAVLLAIKGVGAGVAALADNARQQGMEAPYQGETSADGGQAVARKSRGVPPRRTAQATTNAGAPAERVAPEAGAPAEQAASQATAAPPPGEQAEPSLREAPSSTATRSPRSRPAESTTADDLEAELALIKRATEAKKAGRHTDGLAALGEHAKRFPRGVLADERAVLKAELFCAAGRGQEADALVEAFLRERANSALVGRMRNVCRE